MVQKAERLATTAGKPIGNITRGTTNPNRLRRVDRFIASLPVLRSEREPIVVDLGYGESPTTAIELLQRLAKTNPSTHVVGIEIDRERVERALSAQSPQLHFALGGFEVPMPEVFAANRPVTIIRAFNVLRQYQESDVSLAWSRMQARLSDNGFLIEGTCDELGRVSSWVTLSKTSPVSLSISLRLNGLESPSIVAERLPKTLIHRNVPGEKIHDFLNALDAAWRSNAGLGTLSPVQRWQASCRSLLEQGWPLIGDRKRWRLGELTIAWDAVSPNSPQLQQSK